MVIYIIAGEPSGDLLGANIIQSLKAEISNHKLIFIGIGGERMLKAGLSESLFPMDQISIIDFFKMLPNILRIQSLINKTVKDVLSSNPSMLITIDLPEFCSRVAKKVRKFNKIIKIVHFVGPSVWAYKEDRAKKFAQNYDHLFTLLPFEAHFFEKYSLDTTFFGHYIFERDFDNIDIEKFYNKYDINSHDDVICLTPGSRMTEIKSHLPIFLEAAKILVSKYPKLKISVITANDKCNEIILNICKNYKSLKIVIISSADRIAAYKTATAAIAKSGTNTLELAACNTPFIVAYKMSWVSWLYIISIIRIPYVCLINIIANQSLIVELIQKQCNPKLIAEHIIQIKENPKTTVKLMKQVHQILKIMGLNQKQAPSKILSNKIQQLLENEL